MITFVEKVKEHKCSSFDILKNIRGTVVKLRWHIPVTTRILVKKKKSFSLIPGLNQNFWPRKLNSTIATWICFGILFDYTEF